jgi:hypothetical protein
MELPLNTDSVANPDLDWHLPEPVRSENEHATEISELDALQPHDPNRYNGWDLSQVREGLNGYPTVMLKRATLGSLVARKEVGGLFVAACAQINSRQEQENLFRQHLDINYSDGRRHMKLWLFWSRIEEMLRDRERSCKRRGAPFVVPGYRRCLELAGLEGRSEPPPYEAPPLPVGAEPLPDDLEGLRKLVQSLRQENRLEREAKTRLQVKFDMAQDQIRALDSNAQRDAGRSRGMCRSKGWLRRTLPMIRSEQQSRVEVRIGNCLYLIEDEENIYHAAVTDAPYELGLHAKGWDRTGISFSNALWSRLFKVVRPGGYVAFFAAPRLYHRAAQAAEDVGFDVMPFLVWRYFDGLTKPANAAELFDRDNLDQREVIGVRRGSGSSSCGDHHARQMDIGR